MITEWARSNKAMELTTPAPQLIASFIRTRRQGWTAREPGRRCVARRTTCDLGNLAPH